MDERGRYRDKDFVFKNKSTNINQQYEIKCPNGEMVHPRDGYIYRYVKDTFNDALKNNMVTFKKTNTSPLLNQNNQQAHWNIYIKKYLGDGLGAPTTIIPKEMSSIYNAGTQCVQALFDNNRVFENVKPVDLLQYFIKMFCSKASDIILDFFSGSATTAHAVMKLNAEDGGHRKFIMVQLPELCDEKSEAYKAGYKNICEIGKERIRRAGEQIKAEWEKEHPSDSLFSDDEKFTTDIGFKAFKLDSTNINPWDSEIEIDENTLFNYEDVFKDDRSKEDVLYEIMLKYGIFDMPVENIDVNGKTMFRVGKRYMIVCLEDSITKEDVKAIADLSPKVVVFKESGFKDDNDKINAEYNLNKAGVEDVKCI